MHGLNISHNNITEQSIVYRDLGGKRTYMIADFSEAVHIEYGDVDRSIDFKAAARVVLWAAETIDTDIMEYRSVWQNMKLDKTDTYVPPLDADTLKTKSRVIQQMSTKQRCLIVSCLEFFYKPDNLPEHVLNQLCDQLLILLEVIPPYGDWEQYLLFIERAVRTLHDTLAGRTGLLASGLYLFATDSALHKSITALYMALSNAEMHQKYFKQPRPSVLDAAKKLLMSLVWSRTIAFGLSGILTPWAIRQRCMDKLYVEKLKSFSTYNQKQLKNPSLSIQYI